MLDSDLDALVLSTARVRNDEVAGLVGDRDALSLAIVGLRRLPVVSGEPFGKLLKASLAVGTVSVLLVLVFAILKSTGVGDSPAYAQELVALAESKPRFLIDAPGWKIASVDDVSRTSGTIQFTNGARGLSLSWSIDPRPEASSSPPLEREPAAEQPVYEYEVAGRPAEIFEHPPITREVCEMSGNSDCSHFEYPVESAFVAWWDEGEYSLQMLGAFPSREDFLGVLARLVPVDVDTWLKAMPDSVVIPSDRPSAVAEMLNDIPLPPGFDPKPIQSADLLETRSHLSAEIVSSVACTWTEIWIDADDRGNDELANRAVAAMGTVRQWTTFREMERSGDPGAATFAGYADAMAGGEVLVGRATMDGPTVVREHYLGALRCGKGEDANVLPSPRPRLGILPNTPHTAP